MNELTLHYIWLHQSFDTSALITVEGSSLKVIHPGTYNLLDGPDFLFAHILLDGVSWYGHIELHLKSKDWDYHGHSNHPLYANLILHVILDHFSFIPYLVDKNIHTLILSPILLDKNLIINPKQIESSSSLATEWLKGKSIDEALTIDNMDIVEELALPPVKIHCSVLAEDAIKAAIKDYQTKSANK